ncbi:tail fiber protein [Synechococcus phage S-ShM2]|uniref:Tail fiber protein n=2 Tax=Ahtivirus sagseatwo TaxID=2734079 RepID=A0A1D7SM22_9CAUD|nr:tail fiber protein [Synechococcus phage S-ShM2]AOO13141.1 hypothetical protein LIS021110_027 [Cyanophage S-RIM14]ADO97641.1 structural protein [Synechococcus phage S-ShM2]AOO13573.1 hypothetical protein Np111211_027 [Cyanophage S-RIM14]AOO13789.1 hypothetical protein Np450711_027 [Cyanophage S-RIM14]AOO14005.1 hypothetical protein RW030110_027 [Cyanophage S-RIM14]
MATQTGKLASAKPAATTWTALYRAPIDSSASGVLNMVSDGTAANVRVGVKKYDIAATLDAATYLLHPGDVITNKTLTFDTSIPIITDQQDTFTPGQLITTNDGETTFKWESYYVPPSTDFYVQKIGILSYSIENQTGSFTVGETVTGGTGSGTAVIYDVIDGSLGGSTLYLGPVTGTTFVEGETLTGGTSSATGDISAGGVGVSRDELVFSDNGSGGTYSLRRSTTLTLFLDRTYKFFVEDSSMSGVGFGLSTTINGTFGIDQTAGTSDDGTEYTTGKTSSGTAGSSGAYVQYDMSANGGGDATYYYFDTLDGTLGGGDQSLQLSVDYSYDTIYIYDLQGTLTNASDAITLGQTTFTLTSNAGSKWGYVQEIDGTSVNIVTGLGSADFAGADTFYDVPKIGTASRSLATISSIVTAANAIDSVDTIMFDNSVDAAERLTSLVIGPGQVLMVYAATQNISFDYSGFQDSSSDFTVRSFDVNASIAADGASGGG